MLLDSSTTGSILGLSHFEIVEILLHGKVFDILSNTTILNTFLDFLLKTYGFAKDFLGVTIIKTMACDITLFFNLIFIFIQGLNYLFEVRS